MSARVFPAGVRIGWTVLLVALLGGGCAPRATMCNQTAPCAAAEACLAERCASDAALAVLTGSRRIVLAATDVAFVQRGASFGPGDLPAEATLGRAGEGTAAILFRFPVPPGLDVVAGYLLVDHEATGASRGEGALLHAERIVGAWDPRAVTWNDGPELRDDHGPALFVRRGAKAELRLDVTALFRRSGGGESADEGIALVADSATPDGLDLLLLPGLAALPGDPAPTERRPPQPPRLELYVK